MNGAALIPAPFAASDRQLEAARVCQDPGARIVTLGGAIRSGKTQAAGRLLVEMAVAQPATYLVARSTYRSLKDSTQKAMLHGDGDLPPLIPRELVEQYRASDELVRLLNGAEILFRSLEEGQVGKLLNLTLGGILVDQIEELDGGPNGERVLDTLLGRLSDPRGSRKLLAVANPTGTTHWVYRRLADPHSRDRDARYVHFVLADNAANLPPDYVAAMEATRETRPAWYRSFVLGEWGAFEGQAFTEFADAVHIVDPFVIPEEWDRFESMDHGAANPTAWHAWSVDFDGNLVVFDEYYSPGLVSTHAPEILRRRTPQRSGSVPVGLNWWCRRGPRGEVVANRCWADPSIGAAHGLTSRWGGPASILTEYQEQGLRLMLGNNDRQAGYMRLLELLHVEAGRPPAAWSQLNRDADGAPRLYVFSTCGHLIEQLKSAPIAMDGLEAGEAVDRRWEGEHGHATASLRYGAMSRPAPSKVPPPVLDDPRAEFWRQHEAKREKEWAIERRRGRGQNLIDV